jgi:Ca-activated chloride channel family protein
MERCFSGCARRPSGGQSNFILSPDDVITHLREKIQGLGTQYATNVRLKQQFPRAIRFKFGFKLAPFAQPIVPQDGWFHLGNLEGRVPLTFLMEMYVEPQPIETRITIPLQFVVDIPSQQVKDRSIKLSQKLFVLTSRRQSEPPEAIVEAVRTLNMYRMNERVWEDVDAGHLPAAVTRMKHLATRLLQAGETQLAQQAHMEMERLNQAGTMSEEGRKRLKYGTRALATRAVQVARRGEVI